MALGRRHLLDVDAGVEPTTLSGQDEHPHLAKTSSEELLTELAAREAFGRAAEPWEVADVIVFLASGYSSYMTGEIVSVSSQHP